MREPPWQVLKKTPSKLYKTGLEHTTHRNYKTFIEQQFEYFISKITFLKQCESKLLKLNCAKHFNRFEEKLLFLISNNSLIEHLFNLILWIDK